MMMLLIAIICLCDIIARTYITGDGVYYELISGERKQITGKRKEVQINGEDEKRKNNRGAARS